VASLFFRKILLQTAFHPPPLYREVRGYFVVRHFSHGGYLVAGPLSFFDALCELLFILYLPVPPIAGLIRHAVDSLSHVMPHDTPHEIAYVDRADCRYYFLLAYVSMTDCVEHAAGVTRPVFGLEYFSHGFS
jgi:hypothetical protein